MDSLIEEFSIMSAEVSPMRSTVINSASGTRRVSLNRHARTHKLNRCMRVVQEQQDSYEESRRKIVRGARAHVEAGIERQRVKLSMISLSNRLD